MVLSVNSSRLVFKVAVFVIYSTINEVFSFSATCSVPQYIKTSCIV